MVLRVGLATNKGIIVYNRGFEPVRANSFRAYSVKIKPWIDKLDTKTNREKQWRTTLRLVGGLKTVVNLHL